MSHFIILAQAKLCAEALNAWLGLLNENLFKDEDCRRIVWDRPTGRRDSIEAYEALVKLIETAARSGDAQVPLNDVVVLVDAIKPAELSVIQEGGGWENVVAMLILTFPEIRWVFGVCSNTAGLANWQQIEREHNLSSLLTTHKRDPIFDPTGLRNFVRVRTNNGLKEAADDLRLPLRSREELAAVIDEEKSYAYLHAYAAYRFGCRADVITTWSAMQFRFGNQKDERPLQPHGYWMLLEDMSLNFPDRDKRIHLLRLDRYRDKRDGLVGRAEHCPKLDSSKGDIEDSAFRILVTSGQQRLGERALSDNRAYLRAKAKGKGKIVFKPSGGMFDLWEKAGLRGNAPSFSWPPKPPRRQGETAGHGSPGKLLLVAENMIRRVRALMTNVGGVTTTVRVAVLATDALEITGGRTPTTAVEALSLKHQLEVTAECEFSGVEYHIRIKPRLSQIAHETAAIAHSFSKNTQADARMNAEMRIVNQLVGILKQGNQFDEEQICMNRVRHLHNTLWMRQRYLRIILWPLLRYIELLLSSFGVFVAALVVWIATLSVAYMWPSHFEARWGYALSDAVTSFFGAGEPVHHSNAPAIREEAWMYLAVVCSTVLSGFVHLGVFISHLYSITSRK